jgi:hypothetical protein
MPSGMPETFTQGPRINAHLVPKEPLLEARRWRKACKPHKGMFRSRERDTAPGGQNAGAQPGGDPLLPDGSSGRSTGDGRERSVRAEGAVRCCTRCWVKP